MRKILGRDPGHLYFVDWIGGITVDDLISRKALLEELDKWITPCVNYDKSEFLSGIATAISEVEAAPAVDAAPVVRGEWIELHEENGH